MIFLLNYIINMYIIIILLIYIYINRINYIIIYLQSLYNSYMYNNDIAKINMQ
jgi:hypothetical protein